MDRGLQYPGIAVAFPNLIFHNFRGINLKQHTQMYRCPIVLVTFFQEQVLLHVCSMEFILIMSMMTLFFVRVLCNVRYWSSHCSV